MATEAQVAACKAYMRIDGDEDDKLIGQLCDAAAAYLAALPLKGVGEDSISLDPCDSTEFPNHITLMKAGFINTENLTGLDALLGRRFTFVTLPLKFENADGCSCRAIAMED